MVRLVAASLGLLTAMLAAGCGSSAGPEDKIAAFAKDYYEATEVSCAKEGIAVFVGEREDVYGCLLGVPPENQPLERIESVSQRRCYVFTDGEAFDVTDELSAIAAAQSASGLTVDDFPCLQV